MNNIFQAIFMNIFGYDMIILILAAVTAVECFFLIDSTNKLHRAMNANIFVPDGKRSQEEAENDISRLSETKVVEMRDRSAGLYSVFVNLTGIFPLLGMLGTITSLLGLVADTSDVTGNFYGALTSTFWGLVFAIIFKFIDGVISARVDDNEKSVALYLERNYKASMEKEPEKEKVLL
ncbi:MAG: MotA/TolQ/ExbB proton channel family protein [Muribaculaceae bacterium]|nr:MotA/TolQ/ExbB proton channel family protein [Alistipes senegalensis]MCM1474084.1 MotA/TolQ/ExbB proton channel family protein [Muribaculaceae bacterium]